LDKLREMPFCVVDLDFNFFVFGLGDRSPAFLKLKLLLLFYFINKNGELGNLKRKKKYKNK